MFNFSDNYYLREYYIRQEQVPTLSMMTTKMTPPLAAVYFKSMKPKVKVLAGLEPSLKGGGADWFVPPADLLQGRAVLKPIKKEVLANLNHQGIANVGTAVFQRHRKEMDLKIEKALLDSDDNWRSNVTEVTRQLWHDLIAAARKKNTEHIIKELNAFIYLYRRSIGKIEILFHESAITEIRNTRENAIFEMQNKYAAALKHQATCLYDEYDKKLIEEKTRLKDKFMEDLEVNRTAMADKIHDLKVDKHKAIEKFRQCLECQNLACQIYVALKEREECFKETEEIKHMHQKKTKLMTDTILAKDLEIHKAQEKEKKRQEFYNIWRKKVFHVVKSFQMFVSYCLKTLPDHAEFFINMEKLMLLQVSEALEDATAASIIELEKEQFHTPVPRPKPFYLFCDRGYKANLNEDLCPKHSGTSSALDLPVMIINKRCLYAACDNFEQFTNKMKEFIHGHRGDDADFEDDLVYENFVPVKYGLPQKMLEIKLESSLLQVLEQEMANIQTDENKVSIKCGLSWCSCPLDLKLAERGEKMVSSFTSKTSPPKVVDRSIELDHEREPKWDSFCRHIEPKKCSCAKTAKKHLAEHLPVYMRHMKYGPPEIPGYKICSTTELKNLVETARKEISPLAKELPTKTRDESTQHYDQEFEMLCTCFSDSDSEVGMSKLALIQPSMLDITGTNEGGGGVSASYITNRLSSFATSRAHSLRNLVTELPDIKELFMRKDCEF